VKLRFLYLILLSCLLLGLSVTSHTSYSQSPGAITESDVLALVNSVDKASRKRNIAQIIAPLARDIKIKITVLSPGSGSERVLNLNKDQYAFNLKQTMPRLLAYKLERKNTRVKIYDDDKTAMVTSDVYETVTIRQGTLRAVSSDVTILSLRNGKIVVTSIEATMRFY
jgi:multidrug efflux pump subunit AcrA (membrane-fusion protein)